MPEDLRNNEHLRTYLLGGLPEDEVERLEQRLIGDDDLFELCEAVEADLLAAYDRGELTDAEREQVCRRLAFSPAGRERLAFARSLNIAARESHRTASSVLPFRRIAAPALRPRMQWAALAASLLAVIGILWLALPMIQKGAPPRIANKIPAPATRTGAPEQPGPPVAKVPVAQQPRTKPDRPPQLDERTTAKRPSRPEPFVLALSLAALRGAEDVEEFRIPSGAKLVEVQIDLESLEDHKSFHAAVRNKENGTTVREEGGLTLKRLDWSKAALVLEIPADDLPSGRYEVAVTAGPDEYTTDFEVVRETR